MSNDGESNRGVVSILKLASALFFTKEAIIPYGNKI